MKIFLLVVLAVALNCTGPQGPQGLMGPAGKDGDPGKISVKTGILWPADTNANGNWDIELLGERSMTEDAEKIIAQVWVRMNQSEMWRPAVWYLSTDSWKGTYVRIINIEPAFPAYEYLIVFIEES